MITTTTVHQDGDGWAGMRRCGTYLLAVGAGEFEPRCQLARGHGGSHVAVFVWDQTVTPDKPLTDAQRAILEAHHVVVTE